MQFAGSDLGARLSAAVQTLIVTAQLEGVAVLAYLTWLLERAARVPRERRAVR